MCLGDGVAVVLALGTLDCVVAFWMALPWSRYSNIVVCLRCRRLAPDPALGKSFGIGLKGLAP